MSVFSLITDINRFFEIPTPPFIKFNENLSPTPFIRHLRAKVHFFSNRSVPY